GWRRGRRRRWRRRRGLRRRYPAQHRRCSRPCWPWTAQYWPWTAQYWPWTAQYWRWTARCWHQRRPARRRRRRHRRRLAARGRVARLSNGCRRGSRDFLFLNLDFRFNEQGLSVGGGREGVGCEVGFEVGLG